MAPATTIPDVLPEAQAIKTHFLGVLKGEIFKLSRQRTTWISLALVVFFLLIPWLFVGGQDTLGSGLTHTPLQTITSMMENDLSDLRIFSGFFLIILTARAIGLDYQQGTVRIVIARGVERLQLLGAKLLAVTLAALALLIGGTLLYVLVTMIVVASRTGSLAALTTLNGTFWSDTWLYLLSVAISMALTILLTAALTALGRSLTFGLSLSLLFFPADNIGADVLAHIANATNNDFWLKLSTFLLGPNLNFLPALMLPHPIGLVQTREGTMLMPQYATTIGLGPVYVTDLTHALLVILAFAVIFAAIAIIPTWKRDVME
jgi:ABC-type transport system involved in multi-copper enzyme maturation permease subunit